MTEETKIKIGRLFMITVPGSELSEEFAEFCRKNHFGNFCINAKNAGSVKGLCKLIRDVRALSLEATGEYPFIAIDQEGGWVTRFYEGAGRIPGEMAYAASGADGEKMYRVGKKLGRILRSLGCNINDAPVLDVNMDPGNPIIGTRAYSDRPEVVAELGVNFALGMESEGVMASIKHFPGHGNVSSDTHLSAAVNRTDADVLRKTEFVPFRKAIEAGVGAIMTSHVIYPAFSDKPGTVAPEIITGLLREEMGFEGIAITDSLGMKAIANTYPNGEGAVRSVLAGCDQLLFYTAKAEEATEYSLEALYRAVEEGRITEEILDAALARIARQKKRYRLDECEPNEELANELVYSDKALAENYDDMFSAVTCLKNDGILDSLKGKKILCVSPACEALRGVEEERKQLLSFADLFAEEFENCTPYISSLQGMTPEIETALEEDFDVAVLGIFSLHSKPEQLAVLRALEEKGRPIVAVLLDSPYAFAEAKNCNGVVTCYGYTTLGVKATVDAMKTATYRGKLPVTLPNE
jgi:beta-N-acetylhexosaminidase